jgi:hypothetical protein
MHSVGTYLSRQVNVVIDDQKRTVDATQLEQPTGLPATAHSIGTLAPELNQARATCQHRSHPCVQPLVI